MTLNRNLTLKKDFKRSMYQHFQFTGEYRLTNSLDLLRPEARSRGRSPHLPPSNAGYDYQHEKVKGKAIPLQSLTGPEGSRSLRVPDFKTIGT
jgi:hypothetical protein